MNLFRRALAFSENPARGRYSPDPLGKMLPPVCIKFRQEKNEQGDLLKQRHAPKRTGGSLQRPEDMVCFRKDGRGTMNGKAAFFHNPECPDEPWKYKMTAEKFGIPVENECSGAYDRHQMCQTLKPKDSNGAIMVKEASAGLWGKRTCHRSAAGQPALKSLQKCRKIR